MGLIKTTTSLTIDADLKEMIRIKKIEDPSFNFSEHINNYLRDYFGIELKDLNDKKVSEDIIELEKKLVLAKSQKKQLESEKERVRKEKEARIGVPFDYTKF